MVIPDVFDIHYKVHCLYHQYGLQTVSPENHEGRLLCLLIAHMEAFGHDSSEVRSRLKNLKVIRKLNQSLA